MEEKEEGGGEDRHMLSERKKKRPTNVQKRPTTAAAQATDTVTVTCQKLSGPLQYGSAFKRDPLLCKRDLR